MVGECASKDDTRKDGVQPRAFYQRLNEQQ
jgi:hypothetical protein